MIEADYQCPKSLQGSRQIAHDLKSNNCSLTGVLQGMA